MERSQNHILMVLLHPLNNAFLFKRSWFEEISCWRLGLPHLSQDTPLIIWGWFVILQGSCAVDCHGLPWTAPPGWGIQLSWSPDLFSMSLGVVTSPNEGTRWRLLSTGVLFLLSHISFLHHIPQCSEPLLVFLGWAWPDFENGAPSACGKAPPLTSSLLARSWRIYPN